MKGKRTKQTKTVPTVLNPSEGRVVEVYKRKDGTYTVMVHETHRGLTAEQAEEFKKKK